MGTKKKKKADKPAKALGGLAAAFVDAGLMSEEKARKVELEKRRDQRREGASLGRRELARREAEAKTADQAESAARAGADRAVAKTRDFHEQLERARRAVKTHLVESGGSRRWFFVTRDRRVPYMSVSDDLMRRLESGALGIVESMGQSPDEHVLVKREALTTLEETDRDLVRFWNRSRKGSPSAS